MEKSEQKPEQIEINPRTNKPRNPLPENNLCDRLSYLGSGLTPGQWRMFQHRDYDEKPSVLHSQAMDTEFHIEWTKNHL